MEKEASGSDKFRDSPRSLLEEVCIRAPLYKALNLSPGMIHEIEHYGGSLGSFCTNCKCESVLQAQKRTPKQPHITGDFSEPTVTEQRNFTVTFHCTCCHKPAFYAFFLLKKATLIKVGQYPSITYLSQSELKKYRHALSAEAYNELGRGIALAARGIGLASFVYMRRVFDGLLCDIAQAACQLPGWDQEQFRQCRMDEKIDLLKSYLPNFIVETDLSIVDKGIQELNDEECLKSFPVIKLGIQLILDEKLAKLEEAK